MHFPHLTSLLRPFRRIDLQFQRREIQFLLLGVPGEKYGHHTALVYHPPKKTFRMVVCRLGRMEKEIADAELLGEIRMRRPYAWDEVEQATTPFVELKIYPLQESIFIDRSQMGDPQRSGEELFEDLQKQTANLVGKDVVPVAVYLVKAMTNRDQLLYDGMDPTLPLGYLTYYIGKVA